MNPKEARQRGSDEVARLSNEFKGFASTAICQSVVHALAGPLASDLAHSGKGVALYRALPTEVDLRQLEQWCRVKGLSVFFPTLENQNSEILWREPRASESHWEVHTLGVLQPASLEPVVDPERIGVLVAPGRAFSEGGARVGRGKGHYDRAVAKLAKGTQLWGVAFEAQVFSKIDQNPWDLRVSRLFTEKRVITP